MEVTEVRLRDLDLFRRCSTGGLFGGVCPCVSVCQPHCKSKMQTQNGKSVDARRRWLSEQQAAGNEVGTSIEVASRLGVVSEREYGEKARKCNR